MPDNEEPLDFKALHDGLSQFVESVTGMKKMLMNAGWSEDSAEKLTITMFTNGATGTNGKG